MTQVGTVVGGDRRALAMMLRAVDEGTADHEVLRDLFMRGGQASIIGITGPGGAGKSTVISALIRLLRKKGKRVGIVAVDPTSPRTGGALLGDRIRMNPHGSDEGVFIRSLAARGQQGGLSSSVRASTDVLDAAGYDPIFVETVGTGQGDIEITRWARTTVLVTGVDFGDHIQAMKAGLVEVADIIVVNKGDTRGAREVCKVLESLRKSDDESWRTPVILTVATTGQGIDELEEALLSHKAHLESETGGKVRSLTRWREEILRAVEKRIREIFIANRSEELQAAALRLEQRTSDPMTEADELLYHLLYGTG